MILDVNRALPIFHQIADGMAFAHGKGVLHRDLKPHNIMLTNKPAEDFAKILDFGLAKLTQDSQELTRTGEILGSPVYMSPEQSQGTELDERSDIYSFGVLMYQTLTGSAPIRGSSAAETFALKLTKRPPPFIEVAPGLLVPDELEALVMRCLEVNPDRRISSMRQVKTELENIERRVRDITSDATGTTPQLKLSTRDTNVESFLQSKHVVVDEDGEQHAVDDKPPPPFMRSRVDPVISKRKMMNIVMLVAVSIVAIGVAATVGITFMNKQRNAAATGTSTSESSQSPSASASDRDSGSSSQPTASEDNDSDETSSATDKTSTATDKSSPTDSDKTSSATDSDKTTDSDKASATDTDKTSSSSDSTESTGTKKASSSGMSGGSKSSGGMSGHSGMSDSADRMPAPPSGVSVTESIPLTPKGMSALYQPKSDAKKAETHTPTSPTKATPTRAMPTQAMPAKAESTSIEAPPSLQNKSATKPSTAKSVPPKVEQKPVDDVTDSMPQHAIGTSEETKPAAVPKKASKPKPKKPRVKKKAAPKPAVDTAEAEPPRVRRAYSTWQYYQERTRQGH